MTVSAIEFSRLGPPKLVLHAMRCRSCGTLHPWWEKYTCEKCKGRDLVRERLAGTGELVNYTVVYYPPRDFLGQEPYVVGHIAMDEGVTLPAPVVGIAPDEVELGTPVKATLRRMKLGHEGDIYYSQKFVVDRRPPRSRAKGAKAGTARASVAAGSATTTTAGRRAAR